MIVSLIGPAASVERVVSENGDQLQKNHPEVWIPGADCSLTANDPLTAGED